jgi:SanA protein
MAGVWRTRAPLARLGRMKRILHVIGKVLKVAVIGVGVLVALTIMLRVVFSLIYRADIYTAETVPAKRVAIVFGARVYPNERLSAMLADRVATGVGLYRAGKVDVLLMTGDNSSIDYNEPDTMKARALALGVPEDAIVVDYAGRRTYDSCYRARHIFQLEEAILVTQNFHLDRALLLCNALGVKAVGVGADYQRPTGYSRRSLTYSRVREFPAMLAAVWDIIRRPTPILGEPLPIFGD